VKATSVYHVFVSPKERLLIPKVSSQASDLTRHRTSVKNLFHKAEFLKIWTLQTEKVSKSQLAKELLFAFFHAC
jgi:hypothetical protein